MGLIKIGKSLGGKLRKRYEEEKLISKKRALASKVIREKATSAELKERELQAIRLAKERVRAKTERQIKELKKPRQQFSVGGRTGGFNPGVLDVMGYGGRNQTVNVSNKKRKKRRKQMPMQERYDVVGGINNRYRVI